MSDSISPVKKVALVTVVSPLGVLFQSHQILSDGSYKERGWWNMSETVEPGEEWRGTASRGLREELGLEIKEDRLFALSYEETTKPSPSTREMTTYQFFEYGLYLPIEEAQAATLEEDEGGVRTFFEWRSMEENQSAGGTNLWKARLVADQGVKAERSKRSRSYYPSPPPR